MAKGYKTGGRETGTPNRLTRELRNTLKDVLYNELTRMPETLAEMPTKDRLEVVVKLLSYVCPKVVDISYNRDEPINSNDYLMY